MRVAPGEALREGTPAEALRERAPGEALREGTPADALRERAPAKARE